MPFSFSIYMFTSMPRVGNTYSTRRSCEHSRITSRIAPDDIRRTECGYFTATQRTASTTQSPYPEKFAYRRSQICGQLYRQYFLQRHLHATNWPQIYNPQGSGIWYGRVTTHEVESIVKNTILGGEVLPPLLRGGLNLSRPGCKNLHDW